MDKEPLVSIAVITYQSSPYVVETLESIARQTYRNIELVISDDGSNDGTVDVCMEWLSVNGNRFVRTEVLTVPANTGTSANYNRAEDACRGDWVMTVDGDDMLFPDAVKSYIGFVSEHPGAEYVFAKIKAIGATDERCEYYEKHVFDPAFFDLSPKEQYERLIFEGNCIPSGTCFYKRASKLKYGIRNDERIPLLEDWPKWVNILKKNVLLYFLDKQTVIYRLRDDSVSTSKPSLAFRQSNALMYIHYQFSSQFRKDSIFAIKKLVNAHHILGNSNCFWSLMWNIWMSKRARSGKEPISFF